jgi:glycosyltransferase involved in cell wall biosynthesis
MAQAHLVIVPSVEGAEGRSEGIPVVLMEAMAHGRPVIASRLSGIPELVQAGVTGYLVAQGEVQALSTAIGRVMEEYPSALGLARAGQARVLADYDIGKNANALLELIRESN